jgi:hypothetical protein
MLAERGRDVRVALGLAQLGMAEDLLDDADADALLETGRGCVTGVMNSRGPESGFIDQRPPVRPVIARVDRRASRGAEDQIPVLPCRSGGETLGRLPAAMGAELGDERGW